MTKTARTNVEHHRTSDMRRESLVTRIVARLMRRRVTRICAAHSIARACARALRRRVLIAVSTRTAYGLVSCAACSALLKALLCSTAAGRHSIMSRARGGLSAVKRFQSQSVPPYLCRFAFALCMQSTPVTTATAAAMEYRPDFVNSICHRTCVR